MSSGQKKGEELEGVSTELREQALGGSDSERIADGKVERLVALEPVDVEEA